VLKRHVVDVIEPFRLEKEVSDLPGPHCDRPSEKTRGDRVERQEAVGEQEAQGAEKVQTLGDPALVIKTVVVPALLLQLFPKGQAGYNFSRTRHRFLLEVWKSVQGA
jgi:hypothetical protein